MGRRGSEHRNSGQDTAALAVVALSAGTRAVGMEMEGPRWHCCGTAGEGAETRLRRGSCRTDVSVASNFGGNLLDRLH